MKSTLIVLVVMWVAMLIVVLYSEYVEYRVKKGKDD